MSYLIDVDWAHLFIPEVPLLEILVRGSLTYLGLFLMLRFILKRERGTVATNDLLVIVLLADAAQSAMAGGYQSVTDGLLLVLTIILWDYFLDWLGYHVEAVNRLLSPPPLLLVKDGKMIRRNMRREFVAEEELKRMLREKGVDDVRQVTKAYMEGDGLMSVFTKQEPHDRSEDSQSQQEGGPV